MPEHVTLLLTKQLRVRGCRCHDCTPVINGNKILCTRCFISWNPPGHQFIRLLPDCHYCGIALTQGTRTRDHVVPRALGGPTKRDNLVPACSPCNWAKGARRSLCGCETCVGAWAKYGPMTGEVLELWVA